ncbi:hypothetical protein MJO28_010187 [Puccinia striiformis f. sp. tritici]|uniref:Uncharacterized protein n=2 Tax=Puccinia striiformis f. sp. tritici TaxID=168172 RepID=A0ACC0E4A8_9BASI|nr:hypothetical protein MJO28_010187 [Puccinia striiformis f. sp. tritici]KAI7948263.1 hypothetical protein MJO29_009928 [Puccinia striiformis f. sp. tritici]
MKVEIVVDPSRIPPAPLSTRVAPANKQNAPASAGANGQTTAPGNRRGGARGRGKTGNNKAPQKSAAELDAEMEDYQKANE